MITEFSYQMWPTAGGNPLRYFHRDVKLATCGSCVSIPTIEAPENCEAVITLNLPRGEKLHLVAFDMDDPNGIHQEMIRQALAERRRYRDTPYRKVGLVDTRADANRQTRSDYTSINPQRLIDWRNGHIVCPQAGASFALGL